MVFLREIIKTDIARSEELHHQWKRSIYILYSSKSTNNVNVEVVHEKSDLICEIARGNHSIKVEILVRHLSLIHNLILYY